MNVTTLDSLIAPVTDCLDTPSLRALAELRAKPEAEQRMAWLAGRANEGQLSSDERAEYESCVHFANFLGVLQSKARRKLNSTSE
jgi:hypothetical protein